jgi:REP element-mobilizing transposase RayT
MPHRFQISHDSQALFLTVVTKNRLTVFKTDELKEVVCRALDEARKSAGFLLFAYVIMLDHLHLLTNRPSSTSDVLRVVKSLTARRVIDYLKGDNFSLHSQSLNIKSERKATSIRSGKLRRMYCPSSANKNLWRR